MAADGGAGGMGGGTNGGANGGRARRRGRVTPKGRQVEDAAWDEVRAPLGDRPRRRDR